MSCASRIPSILLAALLPLAVQAHDDPHPASPEQGASPPATQDPTQASSRADETMSEKSPRPLPGKDPEPGPDPKPPIVKKPRTEQETPQGAPRP